MVLRSQVAWGYLVRDMRYTALWLCCSVLRCQEEECKNMKLRIIHENAHNAHGTMRIHVCRSAFLLLALAGLSRLVFHFWYVHYKSKCKGNLSPRTQAG